MKFEPKLYRLSNGVTVILDSMDIETVYVKIGFDTGSRDEKPNEYGITHFCEHVFCNGTPRFPTKKDRKDFLDSNSGTCNASTGATSLCFYGRIIAENLDILLDVLADMLNNALFDSKQIDLERGPILDELRRAMDKPERKLFNFGMKHTYNAFVPNGLLNLGNEETIKSFTSEQLREFASRRMSANNCVVTISGRIIDAEKTINKLENLFAFLPAHNVSKDLSKSYTSFIGHNTISGNKNVQLNILWPTLFKDTYENLYKNTCVGAFESFLRRELMEVLRNKNGLVYGVGNISLGYQHDEIYGISTETSADNLPKVMALIAQTAHRVYTEHPINQQELDKMFNLGRLGDADFLESSTRRCDYLGFFYRFYGHLYDFYESVKRKKSITPEDVIKYTQGYFDGPMSIITQGADFDADLKQIWTDNFK